MFANTILTRTLGYSITLIIFSVLTTACEITAEAGSSGSGGDNTPRIMTASAYDCADVVDALASCDTEKVFLVNTTVFALDFVNSTDVELYRLTQNEDNTLSRDGAAIVSVGYNGRIPTIQVDTEANRFTLSQTEFAGCSSEPGIGLFGVYEVATDGTITNPAVLIPATIQDSDQFQPYALSGTNLLGIGIPDSASRGYWIGIDFSNTSAATHSSIGGDSSDIQNLLYSDAGGGSGNCYTTHPVATSFDGEFLAYVVYESSFDGDYVIRVANFETGASVFEYEPPSGVNVADLKSTSYGFTYTLVGNGSTSKQFEILRKSGTGSLAGFSRETILTLTDLNSSSRPGFASVGDRFFTFADDFTAQEIDPISFDSITEYRLDDYDGFASQNDFELNGVSYIYDGNELLEVSID